MTRNRTVKFKYRIIEYEFITMTNQKIERAKTLHQTNSKLLFYLIILCLKLNRIEYKTIIK